MTVASYTTPITPQYPQHHRRTPTLTDMPFPNQPVRRVSFPSTSGSTLSARFHKLRKTAMKYYWALSAPQRLVLGILFLAGCAMGVVMVVYKDELLKGMVPVKEWMKTHPFAFMLLFTLTFLTSFPPLIGYTTTLTLSGFIYGFPNGWFVSAPATIIGSLTSFHLCRTKLRPFTARLLAADPRFANLSTMFSEAGTPLLVLVRLSPLPYSLSNGALALIPGISYKSFTLATMAASPKLLLSIFIGDRLSAIASSGETMTPGVKLANWIGVIVSLCVGIGGGMWVYRRMQKLGAEVESRQEVGLVGKEDEEGYSSDEERAMLERGARRRSGSGGRRWD